MKVPAEHGEKTAVALSQRTLEGITGGLLIAYMTAVIVAVAARVASNADQEPFRASLQLVAANRGLYLTSLVSNLISNFILIALSGGLYLTFRPRQHYLAQLGTFMFLGAGLIWMVSNISGLSLAQLALEFAAASGSQADMFMSSAQAVELTREFAGKTAFTLAALGLLAFGGLMAWVNAVPRWLGWLAVVVGVLTLSIWYDAAAALHRIGGTGYLLWLLFTGVWLLLKGTRKFSEVEGG